MIYNKQKTNYIMSVPETYKSITETTDEYYNNILKKGRYYVTSDIHGDVILFIRFLVGVYNDLNGTVKSNDSIKRAFFVFITVILWTIFYSM